MQKDVFGTPFNIVDSIIKIKWKITNENRVIAGYNCRKAIGIIMDSVYVFAFYADEIVIPGGPCTINGLPGMILGLTIPRLYTSWIATSIHSLPNSTNVVSPVVSKNIFSRKTIAATILDKTKDWGDENDADSRKWIDQMIWNVLL
jgi:GLPGLI family protein